ncbi:MAG: 4-hydroxy-tetrahydrodipicolinate synthase [Caballeronia sp.]|jgi:4-hydroxy-tetrahydrodipicolinate synthase|uniref:4-hydroxy-tetrahydrodipicolinate synthase n=1 Tax=Caballeronia sp. TaxID=1931223 RepID=UPI00260F0DC9|nr:4-hydroxy-tetrahydrodipicolinate synthase [Caballeronia sp.]MDB5836365.1 4-hydroxy-tetrahydrodipicolinate synthase [Caballeronia sp.]
MTDSPLLQGSIVALLTPMTPDEKIDFPAFERLVDLHVNAGTSAIVVASTTGEGPTLSIKEHVRLYRAAVLCSEGRIPVIAGVGSPSTQVACELAKEAANEQVDAILCLTPYYNRPNPAGLQRHFVAVAEATDTPVILYDVPQRTGVTLGESLIVELAAHPNIIGLKDATGDLRRAERLLHAVDVGFQIVSGDDSTAFALMAAGGAGVISVAANVAPSAVRAMCDALRRGDTRDAARIDDSLRPLYAFLVADTNPLPAKWLAHRIGWVNATLRLPLVIPPELARRLSANDALVACAALLGR